MTQRRTVFAAAAVCLLFDVNCGHGGRGVVDAFRASSPRSLLTSAIISGSRKECNVFVQTAMMTRVNFDAWDNSKSPHVANGYASPDQGNMLWQYAYHGNWHEVCTRICTHPAEARYVRDNGWTPLHLMVAGNDNPVPLEVVKAVYDAFPGALDLRTNDYNRTPLDIAKRWNQRQDIIEFLNNPKIFSLNGKSSSNDCHDPKGAIQIDDDTLLILDDSDDETTSSTTTVVDADFVTNQGNAGADQQPIRTSTRAAKPLSADAIVITNLQTQHNEFIEQEQMNDVKPFPMSNDSSQASKSVDDDKTTIMKLAVENQQLKETEKQMHSKLEEAQKRMERLEEDLTRKYRTEVENRVGHIQNDFHKEISTLKNVDLASISRLTKDLENSKATEEQMRNAVIASNEEIESLKLDLKNSKETEKQMHDVADAATAELDMAQQRFKNLEDQMERLQQRSHAEVELLKHAEDDRSVDMERKINELKKEKDQLQNSLVAANNEVQDAKNQLESVEFDKTRILSFQRDLEKSRKNEEQMRSAVISANAEFREARRRWEGLETQVETLANSERSLLTQVERLRDELKQKQL